MDPFGARLASTTWLIPAPAKPDRRRRSRVARIILAFGVLASARRGLRGIVGRVYRPIYIVNRCVTLSVRGPAIVSTSSAVSWWTSSRNYGDSALKSDRRLKAGSDGLLRPLHIPNLAPVTERGARRGQR